MIKRSKYTKYVMTIALITLLTFMWGCKADIDPPPVAVTGITVTGAEDAIVVPNGSTLQMSAAVLPADATDMSVTWSVVDGAGTATISSTGLLTGTTEGIVTVKATANDDSAIVGELEITVTAASIPSIDVTSIVVTGAGEAIVVTNGSTLQMSAAVLPVDATDQSITWSVVDGTGTATVSVTGLLSATGVGTVTVKATANDDSGIVGELVITVNAIVTDPIAVASIAVTGAGEAIVVTNGSTLQMSAAVLPVDATDSSITWSVVDGTGTATISTAGLLSATGVGTVTVKATANDDSGIVGELAITVNAIVTDPIAVASIAVTGAGEAIVVTNGSTLQMSAAVLPVDATDSSITWSVVDGTGTATISVTGLLSATGVGTVTVKATANDDSGIVGELVITVNAIVTDPIAVASIAVTGADGAIIVPNGSTLQMSAAVLPVDATDPSITWSVVDGTGTATISVTGLLTGTGIGTVTVNATANDDSGIVGTLGITVTDMIISARAITGVTAPVTGESPVIAITNTEEYTSSSVTWTKADLTVLAPEGTYEAEIVYIATITLTPVAGYTLTGVAENFFTVEGATATNASDLGVVTAVFEATVAAPIVPLTRVDLGAAEDFAILAKTGITTTGATEITGDLGISPAGLVAVTGFGETLSGDGTYATSSLVLGGGKIYASNFASPTPDNLIAAIGDMETAYTNIKALANPRPEAIVGGVTLTPGLYKSIPAVSLATNLTLDAEDNADAVWVFQITGALDVAATVEILLLNGAKAENIFWQVTGAVSLLANSTMQGIVLSEGVIALTAGATINGKLLGMANVTLIDNTVTDPSFVSLP